jgi:hypothetical protein
MKNFKTFINLNEDGEIPPWYNPTSPFYRPDYNPTRPPEIDPIRPLKPWGHGIEVSPYNEPPINEPADLRRPSRWAPYDNYDRYRSPRNLPPPSWWQFGPVAWTRYLGVILAPLFITQQAGGGGGRFGFMGSDDTGWTPIPPTDKWGGTDISWYRDIIKIPESEFEQYDLYFDDNGNRIYPPAVEGPVSNQPISLPRKSLYPNLEDQMMPD